jgi:hypothetical protein
VRADRCGGAIGRPSWWRELALIAVTYGIYTLTRNTLPTQIARARRNAMDLYRAEQDLHLDAEHAVNSFLATDGGHLLVVLANYTYSLAHFGVTIAVLVWLYVVHPDKYGAARTVLLLTTLLALVGFWLFPLAPPRFFPELGFVDTVVREGTWGSWGSSAVNKLSNQYAAMPSVHVAWSVWSAAAIVMWARPRWLRIAAVTYPIVVVLVIVGTGNHWTLDAAGGMAAVALGAALWVTLSWARPIRGTPQGT